jgi:hypothetical protein
MRHLLLFLLVMITAVVNAQHCPWDYSGMILLQTTAGREQVYKLKPVLVDENKKRITDTIYGTGLPTYDICNFLYYDDFQAYRTKKISKHHWYAYDTIYHFAKGYYVVKVNFCKYQHKKLFLRFTDPYSSVLRYRYGEIDSSALFHLHSYSADINARRTDKIREAVKSFIFTVDCEKWLLRKEDCK